MYLLWACLGFFLGALPFSVWSGQVFLRTDIRSYGDGNPGAANAWRAGGWRAGLPALALDYLKGFGPVGLAYFVFHITGLELIPVALAPLLGHAFSPFLRFRGGKGLAVTFGIWSGLTLAEGPLALGSSMALLLFIGVADAWAAVFGMAGLLVYLVLRQFDGFLLLIWTGNFALMVGKHWFELRKPVLRKPARLRISRPRQ